MAKDMASPSHVASRTRARMKKEEPFAGSSSGAKPERRKGGSSGAASDFIFLGFGTGGVGRESSGRGAAQRTSSVSGGLGGGSKSDDSREIIDISGSEDDSDEVISLSGSGEEEEESCDYGPQTAQRFELFHRFDNAVIVDENERTNVESDESEGGGDEFLSSACCDDELIGSGQAKVFAKQGEGNGGSFKPKNDDYARNVSRNRTPSITKDDPEAHLSFNYVSSSSESSTESNESGDEDFIAKVSESLSTDGETSPSSEEYVSGSEHEENLEIRKKRKCEGRGELSSLYSETKTTREIDIECTDDRVIDFAGKKEEVECRFSWVNEWLHDVVEQEKVEEATNVELDIECKDDLVIDDAERKNNMECRILWANEWLQGDEGLQAGDDEHGDEGKAGIEFDGQNAGTDVSFVDGGGDIEEMEVVRITQEKRCDKHVQLDSDSAVGYATSVKEVGQKKRNSGMSCGMQQQKEKRKYEDCSSEKAFASRNAEKEQESATDGAVEAKRTVISKLGEHAKGLGSSAEPMMQLRKASETLSKLCKEADANAANAKKKGSSVGRRCQSNEKAVRSDGKDNEESRKRRERASESRTDTLYKLTSCILGKDEILEDAVQNENAEKEKPSASHSVKKEEGMESTEGFVNFGLTANGVKRDCLDEMYEHKKVEEWRKDRRSTRDYHIRWERSSRSKEFKYFQHLSQKYDKSDASPEEIVWELPKRTEPQPEVPPLPLKFFWGDKEPEPAPKSEAEMEMDKMWSDMEFSLRAGELDSSKPTKETETTRATLCPGGKHELICNEEIGLICLFCDQIVLEMKYVLPPFLPSFEKFSIEASSTKALPKGGNLSLFEGICLDPSGNDSVEMSHHQSSSVLDLIPCDQSKLYPHQLEGFDFMWKNLAGSTDLKELSNSEPKDVGGCIISHAPGTGKTCLTILFLHTYLRLFPNSRPAVIAPASMLLTWEEEFRRWNKQWDTSISFHNLNNPEFSGSENPEAVRIVEANRQLKRCSDVMRMIKVYSWSKSSSILGISYNLYEKIAVAKRKGIKNLVKKAELEKKDEEMRKMLLDLPGVVVFDEGHTPRNQRSSIWKLLLKLRTEKRIILSGTPFQNNFLELYNTLSLVRPTIASELSPSLKKFCQTRTTQQKRAKTDDINSLVQPHDKVADEAIVNIRSIMAPFVHVHNGSILKECLPGIKECIVVLNPGEMQKKIVENILKSQCGFEYEFKLSLACIHPSLILSCNASENEEAVISHERQKLEDLKNSTDAGVKTRFLVELIRLSEALGEKVLVFSQYKEPLSQISDQLRSTFQWSSKGKDIIHMHGRLDQRERQRLIGEFNNQKSEARVMLASTKACSEGISLVGASRVVLLDVVWNPSVERQAISRAFRIGQEKVVYTYHLIMKGTAECNKFSKQMEKERLSKMVFSPSYKENDDRKRSGMVSEDKILETMTSSKNFKDMFDQILYQPKDSDADENFHSEAIP